MDKIIEINKVSDTEIEIVEVTPAQAIPEKRVAKTIPLKQLEEEKGSCQQEIQKRIEWRKTPEQEIEKINNEIKGYEDQIVILDGYIQTAKDKGVVESVPVVDNLVVNPVIDNPIV